MTARALPVLDPSSRVRTEVAIGRCGVRCPAAWNLVSIQIGTRMRRITVFIVSSYIDGFGSILKIDAAVIAVDVSLDIEDCILTDLACSIGRPVWPVISGRLVCRVAKTACCSIDKRIVIGCFRIMVIIVTAITI